MAKPGACFHCGKDEHLKGQCPQGKHKPSHGGLHLQEITGIVTVPRYVGFRGQKLRPRIQDWQGPGLPYFGSCPHHPAGASGDSNCRRPSYCFLLDTGATFSALLSNLGPPSTKSAIIPGISEKLITILFTQQLNYNWDSFFFLMSFW